MPRHRALRAVFALALFLPAVPVPGQPSAAPGGIAYSPGAQYDQMSWEVFIQAMTPSPSVSGALTFETWATDAQTYTANPVWPSGATRGPDRFQVSRLQARHLPSSLKNLIEANCSPPGDASVGLFPSGKRLDCFAEEVRRNRPSFDYIVNHGLFTQAGLVAAYQRWAASGFGPSTAITFPPDAIELKVDWVPVVTLREWLTANDVNVSVEDLYYVVKVQVDPLKEPREFALVSMHISSKQLPNWLWATFEHQMSPGRCDTMGCFDQYGAVAGSTAVRPASTPNGQYGLCVKSAPLSTAFTAAKVPAVFNNYCLKATQIDYVSPQGTPLLDGNSVTERLIAAVPISTSSCISCHTNAAFDSSGGINGIPSVIGNVTLPSGLMAYDFVWGLSNIP